MTRREKWTLNTVWYLFLSVMQEAGKEATRGYVKSLIKVLCDAAGVTRESLGIFAGVRASLYFDGEWRSVSFDSIKELAEKGTDVVFIEKEGVPEVLTDYADKYGVAMVNTRGHLTEYGKDLMREAKKSGAHVVIMSDYDATGVKIASETPLDMPWIGVNEATLEYFYLPRESPLSIASEPEANKEYVRDLVRDGRHPSNAKNDNAGKRDNRFKDVDVDFLMNERVEIDAILAKTGSERFWEYIMDRLTELFPTRNYNRVIELPTEYYSKEEGFDTLPDAIKKVLIHIEDIAGIATEETENGIETELGKVEGFLEVPEKRKEITERLTKVLVENEDMKVIIAKFEELLRPGVLPEVKQTKPTDDKQQ